MNTDRSTIKADTNRPSFLDFFAGSGLVSEGLKDTFVPVWANDICPKKAAVFCANHPKEIFHSGSIENVNGLVLPDACLSWGSFPCQDLSLAGNIKGISSTRSGLVWQWFRVMDEMKHRPPIVVAENVIGLISASKGAYYRRLHESLVDRGYKVGGLVLDAAYWVPQSRKRVFIIAVKKELRTEMLETDRPLWCHPESLIGAVHHLKDWIWWSLPRPPIKRQSLADLIELDAPSYEEPKSKQLISLIPEKHKERMKESLKSGQYIFPGYKRIRNGRQVLELRFDGIAGCLRTPEGGSSRQFLLICQNGSTKTRLLTVGEAASLMGVRKSYKIPGSYNEGYKAMGDAVAVPVTRYLARKLLYPLAQISFKEDGNGSK